MAAARKSLALALSWAPLGGEPRGSKFQLTPIPFEEIGLQAQRIECGERVNKASELRCEAESLRSQVTFVV